MMAVLIRLLSGRFGLAAIALVAALSWHYIDKAAAVRSAENAIADAAEIDALRYELETAKRLAENATRARDQLAADVIRSNEAAEQMAKELEDYEADSKINPDGVVDDGVLSRLRNR